MSTAADTRPLGRPLGQRLREDTRDLHTQAEKSTFQALMVKGELPKAVYVEGLGQMLLMHRALEAKLRDARAESPALAAIVTDQQFREAHIERDLAHFGVDQANITPSPATAEFVASLEGATPMQLLGMHYVLEGSNNGNRFIARAVAGAYRLDGAGLAFLMPHGEQQPAVWEAFKAAMAEQDFTEAEMDEVVAAAKHMFHAIIAIHEGLLPA